MKLDLNKFLKLHIRGKLVVAFAGLSILPLLVVGMLGINSKVTLLREVAVENLSHDLLTIKERLGSFLTGMDESIDLLTNSTAFSNFVDSANSEGETTHTAAETEVLDHFLKFAQLKNIFYQIKFIDRHGVERFTIEKQGASYEVLPERELNRFSTSFYMYIAGRMAPRDATVIPVELTGKDGQSLFPALSCIYPVGQREFGGLLVFQIYADAFFKIVEQEIEHSSPGTVMLVNAEGYYLYHSAKKKQWNRLLASKDVSNLSTDFGAGAAEQLLTPDSEFILELKDVLVAHAPLFTKQISFESDYTILKSVSKAEIFKPAVTFRQFFLAILTFFLSMSLLLAYVATHQFTNPIQRLRREAEVIAMGNYHARVDVRTYDEIEELAEQFNVMAASLEQRDEEIASYQKHLEDTVQERTGELRKEKDKLQAILDNVPSGFILLDPDRTILSASAALVSITGKQASELVGRKCYDVIGNDSLCSGCPTDEVLRSGKMATTITRGLSPEGEDRYLEHISVPLRRNGSVDNVLEIITDVTRRKRLQDQLVRSERLAATGEIAAVIAHEMRNSLTSTRMILQLFKENDSISDSDQESLDVALDSLGRMEGVVSNLLQLARPAQLEKKLDSIARVAHEAVEFALPQIASKDIDLVMRLRDDLPDIEIDGDRMKEALVNLILNASQSIESRGTIMVSSEMQTLPRKLRDLGEVRVSSGEEVAVAVKEVVLRKGANVVVVRVRDSGCGMPQSHLKRIFDPFFTTKVDGTGLGLSFVKRVVNEHGGVVTVESEVGKGSCFSMIIPGAG